jgi:hypothetical protein
MVTPFRNRLRIQRSWTWAGASVRGTSHLTSGDPKQDTAAVAEYLSLEGSVLVVVVCDGAGSASRSDLGARIACLTAHSLVRSYLENEQSICDLNESLAHEWLLTIRKRLFEKSQSLDVSVRELATTISIAILGRCSSVLIVVGDSPCVIYDGDKWVAPIWPMNGEYANQTYFVTQDPIPVWKFTHIENAISKVAVFTDGIDKLVLRDRGKEVFDPFFDGIFGGLEGSDGVYRNREYSKDLESFLSSDRVNNLTDDDKTLVIASRTL